MITVLLPVYFALHKPGQYIREEDTCSLVPRLKKLFLQDKQDADLDRNCPENLPGHQYNEDGDNYCPF